MWIRSSIILFLLLILASSTEMPFVSGLGKQDDDWRYIGTSKEGVKLYYSAERTAHRGSLIQAWFKSLHPETDKKISYAVALNEFNCRKGSYRGLQGTLYYRDESASTSNKPSAWEHSLTGFFGGNATQTSMSGKGRKATSAVSASRLQ